MALVEIDEADLEQYQRALGLLKSLSTNDAAKPLFQKALKAVNPEIKTDDEVAAELAKPHLERVEGIAKTLEERLAAIDEREAKSKEREADLAMESKFADLRKRGWTDDGMEKLKQHMISTQTVDPLVAAAHYEAINPAPKHEPAGWEPDTYDLRKNAVADDIEGLFADEDKWADKAVGRVLAEERAKYREV